MGQKRATSVAAALLPTEHDEQATFVQWFRLQFPKVLIFAIPNGAYLSGTPQQRAAQMARLKAEGLVPGVPDLCVPEWDMWIEFKRQRGGRVSEGQSRAIGALRAMRKIVIVAKGCEDAIAQMVALSGGRLKPDHAGTEV